MGEERGVFIVAEAVVTSGVCIDGGVGAVHGAVAAEGVVASGGLEAGILFRGQVADVLLTTPAADGEPAEASADSFDEVPGVEDVSHGVDAEWAASIGCLGVW